MGSDSRWRTSELAESFLNNVRSAIPLAAEQIEILLHIIASWDPDPVDCLDLGCGDGTLGRALLDRFPSARVTFIDFSEPMLSALTSKLEGETRYEVIEADFSTPAWLDPTASRRFDVVVSGFSIHHQPDGRKRELYGEIFERLRPGGIFLNLEHVSSASPAVKDVHDEYFLDHLFAFHSRRDPSTRRDRLARDYYHRPDKEENILAPTYLQCSWLEAIGFEDVDCYFKVFELAIFGGRKPRA